MGNTTYYRLVKAGKLHPRRVGVGKVLIPRAEVDALLEGRQYRSEPEGRAGWGDPGYPLAR
jgi:excisionase family DNA binding protein